MIYSPVEERILVTGASGQLGIRLVGRLADQGIRVEALDRVAPLGKNVQTEAIMPGVRQHVCDLSAPLQIETVAETSLNDVTHLVHLASTVSNRLSTSLEAPREMVEEIHGILRLLRLLPSLKGICFASSIMVYGETLSGLITENDCPEPKNPYAVTKLAIEKILRIHGRKYGVNVTILRLAGVYGATIEGSRAIPSFIRAALECQPLVVNANDSVERDYLYIDDAIDAFSLAIARKLSGVFNVGSGKGATLVELADMVLQAVDTTSSFALKAPPRGIPSGRSLVYDIAKVRKFLGFAPNTDLTTGLGKLITEEKARRGAT